MRPTNLLKALRDTCWMQRIIRRLSAWAWAEMLFDVGRVEWKYGRNDNGSPKNWTEWNNVRMHLRETGMLRQPKELESPAGAAASDRCGLANTRRATCCPNSEDR